MADWLPPPPQTGASNALTSDFRPRSNSELLDAAFEIYRRHFLVLMAVSVFAAIPTAIAAYVGENGILLQSTDVLLNSLLVRLAGLLLSPFVTGAIACVTSAAYLGQQVDLGQIARMVFQRPVRLFVTTLSAAFLIGLGLVFFIVPGFIFYKRYFAVLPVVLFERLGTGATLKRSRELSNGSGSRIFGLIGAVFLFSILVSAFLGGMIGSITHGAARAVGELMTYTIITPFSTIAATLLYYDIRIRKEGYDIELMAQALPGASPELEPSV